MLRTFFPRVEGCSIARRHTHTQGSCSSGTLNKFQSHFWGIKTNLSIRKTMTTTTKRLRSSQRKKRKAYLVYLLWRCTWIKVFLLKNTATLDKENKPFGFDFSICCSNIQLYSNFRKESTLNVWISWSLFSWAPSTILPRAFLTCKPKNQQ